MFDYLSLQPQGSEPILPVIASSGLSADDYEGSCGFGFGMVSPSQEIRVQGGHCEVKGLSLRIPNCTGEVVGTPDRLSKELEGNRV